MNEQHFDLETVVNRKGTGNLKEYLTPEAVKREGLVTFNAAEMDFKTAPAVCAAMEACAREGLFGFNLCDDTYQQAVCDWMEKVRRQRIEKEWIVPTMGTIFSVATCIRMCVAPGQRMIIQPPVYNRYKQAADRIGRETAENPLQKLPDGSYAINLKDLEEKMADPKNTLLVICNPHNPTGSVWDKETLEKIARMAVKYDVTVYSDEIFADYAYTEQPVCMYTALLDGKNNGISATSLGKTFNFTGVNHANMLIADPRLRERFIRQRFSDHYGSLESMHRAALLGAYSKDGRAWKEAVQVLIWENYQTVQTFFKEHLPEVVVSPLQGGYVVWMDWSRMPEGRPQRLMEDARLVLEDGEDFGCEKGKYTRMCIATPKKVLQDALTRLLHSIENGR